MKFTYWHDVDIGRPPITQRADCTLTAIAFLCGMDYCEADRFLSGHGRDRGRGVSTIKVLNECNNEINGYKFTKIQHPPCQVWKFVKDHPTGSYLLRIRGHVLVLHHGTVYDYANHGNEILDWAMEVTHHKSDLTLEDLL